MKFKQCFLMACNMVTHSRLRSWLTIIGIIIGVASIITLVSVGDGMSASVDEKLSKIGSNLVTISPGYSKSTTLPAMRGSQGISNADAILDRNDVQVLKGIMEIEHINTKISGKATISYLGDTSDLQVTGVDQKIWSQTMSAELLEGRFLISSDQNTVVIGESLAKDQFDNEIGLNQILTIGGKGFRVVGIVEGEKSTSIYIPLNAAYQIIEEKTKRLINEISK